MAATSSVMSRPVHDFDLALVPTRGDGGHPDAVQRLEAALHRPGEKGPANAANSHFADSLVYSELRIGVSGTPTALPGEATTFGLRH